MDMETRDRLKSGRGNAMLVSGSIYQACKFYELFAKTDLKGKCAIVTSYKPLAGRHQGRGNRRGADREAAAVRHLPEDARRLVQRAAGDGGEQGREVREGGEEEVHRGAGPDEAPDRRGQAADRLRCASGHLSLHRQADARPRAVPGHLPREPAGRRRQGIRLHHRLQGSLQEPRRSGAGLHSGALDGYDKEDVAGLLEDRLEKARERLEEAREAVKALCEPVEAAEGFGGLSPLLLRPGVRQRRPAQGERAEAPGALQAVAAFVRAFANLANEMHGGRLHRRRDRSDQGRGRALRKGPRRGEAGQRRLHRPEDVRAGHASPDRHLHPRRGEREDLGLRRHVAGPADRGAWRRCGERSAQRHSREPRSDCRDHREQRPQAHHRRAADQSEVLRQDVGAYWTP